MTPRVRLGTSLFALYSQTCGEAAVVLDVSDVNCSRCVDSSDLADSVQSEFAGRMHSHVLFDISDRETRRSA
jgi:hypothetical protein